MPAYLMMRITIHDSEKLKAYQQAAPSVIEKFNGKILVRGGEVTTLEGPDETRRIVMIEFPDLLAAKSFYQSEEYTQAKKLRMGVAEFEMIAIDGV